MHYVASEMQSGVVPYKDIFDINLPGSYVADWVTIRLFGDSDLAWRFYDFGLLLLIGGAMWLLLPARRRFPAVWAACIFALIHARDGVEQAGQRDLTAAALAIAATALLVRGNRSERWDLRGGFGVCVGMATLIKPTLILLLLLPLVGVFRREKKALTSLLVAIAGFLVPCIVCVAWLSHKEALQPFIFCMFKLARFHSATGHARISKLLYSGISPLLPFASLWLISLLVRTRTSGHIDLSALPSEKIVLWAAMGIGLLSYFLQGKGFLYQRYPLLVFLLILACEDLSEMLRGNRFQQLAALSLLIWTSFVLGPSSVWKASHYDWQHRQFVEMLRSDLGATSGPDVAALSGRIQCVDSISGCVETLYKLHLRQSSRALYDEFLFHNGGDAVSLSRAAFLRDVQNPPQILVISESLFPSGPSNYQKIALWPQFDLWLSRNYSLVTERRLLPVQSVGRPFTPAGYRLYVLRR